MVDRRRKKKRSLSLRFTYILCILCFVLASFGIYFFSFDSRAHVLGCRGNYYYRDNQIYEMAGLSTNTRLWLMPDRVIEKRLLKNPLIESVSVHKSKDKLDLTVREKTIVGYYIKDNKNYVLTSENESISLDEKYLKTIVHFPLLSNFSDKQMQQIAKNFKKHKKILSRAVIEKVAEMVPFQTSYDDNMIQMTMQDGNIVYTSMDSISMMANYQAMLTQLHGQNACLFLDAAHSAIDKVDCGSIDSFTDEKSEAKKEEPKKEDPVIPQEEPEQVPVEESVDIYEQATDWYIDESMLGLEYSPSLDVYRDPNTGLKYRYNPETASFDQILE